MMVIVKEAAEVDSDAFCHQDLLLILGRPVKKVGRLERRKGT
jgi:hypothetical protein